MSGHPTFAEIDLGAISKNLSLAVELAGARPILGVVKANAYGHGALPVARHLINRGVPRLGVAFLKEGIELREGGINAPILVLAGCSSEEAPEILRHRLTPVVFDEATLAAFGREALKSGESAPIHIKVDTGMGRIGVRGEAILPFIEKALRTPGVRVEGVLSHFAEADIDDRRFAAEQIRIMSAIREKLNRQEVRILCYHMANSAAVMELPESHFDLVRPGLMLYGYSPFEKKRPIPLRPALRLLTTIGALKRVGPGTPISYGRTFVTAKESLIATVPVGYADGYPRSLSNRGEMIVRGVRAPVVGRVCMDMTMIDVTDCPEAAVGDRVTVIGEDQGAGVFADDLARWAGTIPYEILCGIGPRVPRRYREET
jgi:alanine racemase